MEDYIDAILDWYYENKRDLPWRRDKNPYHVWISEIMLQQTRIEAVIHYYNRFLKEIPTIYDLAVVSDDKLLKLWEGLGYYNRAHNLKKAAQMIIKDYNGVFPSTYEEILKLSGVGEYTASAISSICFQKKEATIDGNVLRVYTRFFNDSNSIDSLFNKKRIREHIKSMLPLNSGDFNEALMEIGEVICIPNEAPKCMLCPLANGCLARKNNNWNLFPVKKEKTLKKEFHYTILMFQYDDKYAILKRNHSSLLKGLWEFPNIEGKYSLLELKEYLDKQKIIYEDVSTYISNKHIFTHQIWYMDSYIICLKEKIDDYIWVTLEELKNVCAIPTAFQPFLQNLKK